MLICCRDGLTQLSKSTDRHEPLLGHLIHVASKVAHQGEDAMGLLHRYTQNITLHSFPQTWIPITTHACTAEGCEQGFRTVINDGPQGCMLSDLPTPNVPQFPCTVSCCTPIFLVLYQLTFAAYNDAFKSLRHKIPGSSALCFNLWCHSHGA